MRRGLIHVVLVTTVVAAAAVGPLAQAQQPAGRGGRAGGAAQAPSPPAPQHDLSGVWMMRNPPGSNRGFTNYTFTDPKKEPPALTAWGEARFKEAKDSNGGTYT